MIQFSPSREVVVSIFSFSIHWYGLLYLAAFALSYYILPRIAKYRSIQLSSDDWASVLSAAVLGVIIGGRLGYIFLYKPSYFFQTPSEIFMVWHGGMASHGGVLGVMLFVSYAAWQRNISIAKLADIAVVPAAIGLALGRFGNFINQELYGTITSLPWAMQFPEAEGLRHPLQLYGVITNLLLAATCYWYVRQKPIIAGRNFALFCMLYSLFRFSLEFIREQQHSTFSVGLIELTRGQLYTVPLFILGLCIWRYARR